MAHILQGNHLLWQQMVKSESKKKFDFNSKEDNKVYNFEKIS
jgi:hypothetical protein